MPPVPTPADFEGLLRALSAAKVEFKDLEVLAELQALLEEGGGDISGR